MDNAEIIAHAVREVPGTAFQTRQVADMAVTNMALRIRSQLSEGSLAMRTLDSVPILATIEEIKLEESSKRLLVTFRPDHVREGYEPTETIRTDRTDGWRGESVRKLGAGSRGITCACTSGRSRPATPTTPRCASPPTSRSSATT